MKMEPIVSSKTSAIRTQTPGNYPKKEQITFRTRRKLRNKNNIMFQIFIFFSPSEEDPKFKK